MIDDLYNVYWLVMEVWVDFVYLLSKKKLYEVNIHLAKYDSDSVNISSKKLECLWENHRILATIFACSRFIFIKKIFAELKKKALADGIIKVTK